MFVPMFPINVAVPVTEFIEYKSLKKSLTKIGEAVDVAGWMSNAPRKSIAARRLSLLSTFMIVSF